MIQEIFLKEIAKRGSDILFKHLKNTGIKSYVKERDILEAISQHLTFVRQWSSEVSFSDLKNTKSTKKVFVDIELYFQPLRQRLSNSEQLEKLELKNIFSLNKKHIALLGQVGSGKTTSLKYFCQSLLFNEGYFENEVCFPIVIKLNDFNGLAKEVEYSKNILFNSLIDILGIKFDFKELDEKSIDSFKEKTVISLLNEMKFMIFIDGFDELIFLNRRDVFLSEFEKIVYNVENSRVVLTSRTSDYKYSYGNVSIYEICSLNDFQIEKFAEKWLENPEDVDTFLEQIKKSPFYDTAIRPLTIAHLCAIFERTKAIPEKPKTVYKKVVTLMLEQWDEQRNISRKSKYAKFENDRKFDFLSSFAYNLSLMNLQNSFSTDAMKKIYLKINSDFDLDKSEVKDVISEIESHSGLITQTGFENFAFAHKSIQEYLSAEYIVKLPSFPENRNAILRMPNELAVAVAVSSNPSSYFEELVNKRLLPLDLGLSFLKPFLNRLLLEKIDFNNQFGVGIAALSLYSAYIKAEIEDQTQLRLFFFDELLSDFEFLIRSILKRNPRGSINEQYIVESDYPTTNGYSIVRLKNIRKSKALPEYLYCRDKFWKSKH